jgi:hypothetical protein
MTSEVQNMEVVAILVQIGTTTDTIEAKDCLAIWLDEETKGVFYRLNPVTHPLPITDALLYAPPYHIINIMFKPRK